MINFTATANSPEDAEEMQSALNSLLLLTKSYGKAFLTQTGDQDSPIVSAGNEVLASLKADRNDTRVEMTIKAPAAMATASPQIRQRAQEATSP